MFHTIPEAHRELHKQTQADYEAFLKSGKKVSVIKTKIVKARPIGKVRVNEGLSYTPK